MIPYQNGMSPGGKKGFKVIGGGIGPVQLDQGRLNKANRESVGLYDVPPSRRFAMVRQNKSAGKERLI
jgi:hypothetical protein